MKVTLKLKQNFKFLIVGGIGVIINFIVYKGGLFINFPNDVAWLIGIIASAQSNYILNAKWTFKEDIKPLIPGFTNEELIEINEFLDDRRKLKAD